jgi:integrase
MSRGQMWAYFAKELNLRPDWVAQQTGIVWLAYGPDLEPPKPLPSFKELEQTWRDHFKKSPEQKRKVLRAWEDFKTTAKVLGLKDIITEAVIAYRDVVHAREASGKSQSNLFTRIRRLISFAKSRGIAVEKMAQVLTTLSLLTPSESTVSLNPQPVEVDDFKALLKAADGEDLAMVLLMLNGAFYCAEVIRLKWTDIIKGCIVTHRAKEGRCVRVCVLWPETLAALAKVKQKGEYIFYNYAGAPLGIKGAEKRFRELRDAAKVEHVTSSQLRDGAATAMAQANVTEKLCNLLLGHRAGIGDHYVKRNPQMVAPACEAIYRHYFVKGETN